MDNSDVTGRAKGGKKRAEMLSPEERKEIALKAAEARWGEKPLQVLHQGTFEKEFGIDIDCYVLDDATKTAVISQRGMGQAIGLSKRGDRLTYLSTYLSNEAPMERARRILPQNCRTQEAQAA